MDDRSYFAAQEEISACQSLEAIAELRPRLLARFAGDVALRELLHSLELQVDGIRELRGLGPRPVA